MKSTILRIIGILFVFLMIAHTTINGVFPYIHMEYPVRAIAIVVISVIVGLIGRLNTKVMRSKEYDAFVLAYDNIDVRAFTDEELKHYADLCNNGLLEANEELYRRGL